MSLYEGKKIVSSFAAFTEAASGQPHPLEKIAHALKTRTLGEMHFKQASDFLDELSRANVVKLYDKKVYNPALPLPRRNLAFMQVSMSAHKHDPNIYQPRIHMASISASHMTFSYRRMPVLLSSEHVERRYVSKTSHPIKYDSRDFCFQTLMGAHIIAQVMDGILRDKGEAGRPVSVPGPDGFFLGQATAVDQAALSPKMIGGAREASGKFCATGGFARVKPQIQLGAHVYLRTHISFGDMSPDQKALHRKFAAVFAGDDTAKVFAGILQPYAVGHPPAGAYKNMSEALIDRVTEILHSPLWAAANQRSTAHLDFTYLQPRGAGPR